MCKRCAEQANTKNVTNCNEKLPICAQPPLKLSPPLRNHQKPSLADTLCVFKYDDNETWSTLMEDAKNELPLSQLRLEK